MNNINTDIQEIEQKELDLTNKKVKKSKTVSKKSKKEITPKVEKVDKSTDLGAPTNQYIKTFSKHGYTNLAQIFGEDDPGYMQKTPDEYEEFLNNLDMMDLQEHATKFGVIPRDDRRSLMNILIREFNLRNSQFYQGVQYMETPGGKKVSDEVRKILAEGR